MAEVKIGNVSDVARGQMAELKANDQKVLVFHNKDGTFNATSHLCPHYKAPLSKGTFATGRVMCPWHGACFSTKTGDVEDGPAVDSLLSYPIRVDKSGDLYVTINVEDPVVKVGKRVPKVCKASNKDRIVVVGGGAGGLVAVESLRSNGWKGAITLISREPHVPVDRPKISKMLNATVESIGLRNQDWFKELQVDTLWGTQVVKVDTAGSKVELSSGETLDYKHLILATGGDPRHLPIPGGKLGNIFVVRTLEDSRAMDEAIKQFEKAKVVIVGSSFIGLEAAAVLAKNCDVTVIGMEKVPFERVLGHQIGKAFQDLHEKNGVKFRMEAVTEAFEGEDKVKGVKLKGGEVLEADVVVLGVGVKPATDFLKGSGISLEKDGGILVDGQMRVSDLENVYVVGDIAKFPYHLNNDQPTRIEHWNVAQNQARLVGKNIATGGDDKFEAVPFFWSMQYGKSVRYAGHALHFDDIVVKGEEALTDGFEAYYCEGEKIVGVASLARDPLVATASELYRLGKMPTKSEIQNGVKLQDLLVGEPEVSETTEGSSILKPLASAGTAMAAAWGWLSGKSATPQ